MEQEICDEQACYLGKDLMKMFLLHEMPLSVAKALVENEISKDMFNGYRIYIIYIYY